MSFESPAYYQAGELVRCSRPGCKRGLMHVSPGRIVVALRVRSNNESNGLGVIKCELCGTLTQVEDRAEQRSHPRDDQRNHPRPAA